MEKLKELTLKIRGGWDNIDKKKKNALILAIVSLISFILVYAWYSGKVEYVPLFTNLDLQDAASITADLDARKDIDYRIENGGKDIYIDEKHVDKYRLDLAMNGMMPENSTGFEIFDDMGMMVTDEDRKIMYQRALEGELQRSVMSLTEIEAARVHLVMSQDSIFDTEKRSATASVILDVKTGSNLSDQAVSGIVALISGAVDSLPEENVRVIDTYGNLLNAGLSTSETNAGIDMMSKYSEIRSGFESELKNNILNLLGPAFGPEKIKVSVYADLDFDAEEQTVISYENPVVRSEQMSAVGSELDQGSIMNDPIGDSAQNVLSGVDDEGLSSFDGTVNYELTESRTNTVKAPGKVVKISTSVLYDGDLTQGQRDSIRNLVATATGYDVNRGDLINVEGVVFDREYQLELEKELEEVRKAQEASRSIMDRYGDYILFGVFSLLGLLIFISVLRMMLGRRRKEDKMQLAAEMSVPMQEPENLIDEVVKKFEVKENQQEKQIKEYAQEHPEIAADLIKAWMKD
ncbi:flagellar basal-body MS-ring/collar protein FliF [Alkalibacter mobilis]|uniref:flagellar basal-body MS-ring/collar protein FliF n=1 Tax=Alkalibacter mobilis TaxID=2787712 RepID=UPI00189C7214|nr:flagellar basal-body MS-ring/collar protein FliF [Alkalibacter mobilis]MBF7096324.1 flagellar M-ring protein FliF [Alkalibacter mobilis]